jgi:hypothetical protein
VASGRFTESQIREILKEHYSGASSVEILGRHGIDADTLEGWKTQYETADATDVSRFRHLAHKTPLKEDNVAPPTFEIGELPEIVSKEARVYAVVELARRAGVPREMLNTWKVDVKHNETVVRVQPGTNRTITFPHSYTALQSAGTAHPSTQRKRWMVPPDDHIGRYVPDFIIPFCEAATFDAPLFLAPNTEAIQCSCDLLAATLLTLSRYEEHQSSARDEHGRFPATAGLAGQQGFLDRPIVDEYGLGLEQALAYLLPGWQPANRRLRVKLSHDMDLVGIPVNLKTAVGHMLRRHNPLAVLQDLISVGCAAEPAYLQAIRAIASLSLERGLDSAVYWQASRSSKYDSGYDPLHPKVKKVIAWLQAKRVEMGVHPGYDTFRSLDRLAAEINALRELLGEWPVGGRQHYLRWSPDTWRDWEACGLAYDSTLGFADRAGFRAGTCIPYHPWLLESNRESRLLEIPLIAMDGTLLDYMQLTPAQSLQAVTELVARCRTVGGVFTLLWHNSTFIEPAHRQLYTQILDLLAGADSFDWKKEIPGYREAA